MIVLELSTANVVPFRVEKYLQLAFEHALAFDEAERVFVRDLSTFRIDRRSRGRRVKTSKEQ